MAFYENTLIAKQDLSSNDLDNVKTKYNDLINSSSGKVIKIEEWGLISLTSKIKNYKKGFYIHYKFEGSNKTIEELRKKLNIDSSVIRHLIVKYNKLDTNTEYFKKTSGNLR